jgi:hypothetical protein
VFLAPRNFCGAILLRLSSYGKKCKQGVLLVVLSLYEKQKGLRAGNDVLFGPTDLESREYQNRYYVPRNQKSPEITKVP